MLYETLKKDINIFNSEKSLENSKKTLELEIRSENENCKKPIKEYRGNQHDLDTYLNTINYMEYVRNNRKNVLKTQVITQENTFNDISSIQSHFEKNQFNKKWSRLDRFLKKIKLDEFISKQITENNITIDKKKYYLDILIRMLDNKKLNKKSEIIYDENNGYIVNIPIFKSLIS